MENANQPPTDSDRLHRAARAVSRLAGDPPAFRAATEAFTSGDAERFHAAIRGAGLWLDCELICFWLRTKICVIRCIEFCGLPEREPSVTDIQAFAHAISGLQAEPAHLEQLAAAFVKNDSKEFKRSAERLGLLAYCHLLCHWICYIHYRLVCERFCRPIPTPARDLRHEVGVAASAIRALAKDTKRLDQAIAAAESGDSERLVKVIGVLPGCFYLCEWFCATFCILTCWALCKPAPTSERLGVEEILAFAKALGAAEKNPRALDHAWSAVLARDAKEFSGAIRELKLERYCLQFCHWVCFEICRLRCIRICPPIDVVPLFTHVGQYRVDPIWADFAPDGTTTSGNLAFTQTIPLIGIMPDGSAVNPIEYRFLFEQYPLGVGPQEVTAAMVPPTVIGELEYWEWDALASVWKIRSAEYWVNNPGAPPITINQPSPNPPLGPFVLNKQVKLGGWIEVPRENDLTLGGVGRFIPHGNLILLDTTKLTNEIFDLSVNVPPLPLRAGDTVPAAQRSTKPIHKLTFEARNVTTKVSVGTNDREKIALSNTTYTYVRHPNWAGGPVTTVPVVSLDLVEIAGGCSPVQTHVHAKFTAYHPYIAGCSVYLEGPGVPPPPAVTPPIAAGEATSPAAGEDFNITGLQPCAYIAWLSVTLRLTTGWGAVYGPFTDHIAFCKR